MGSTTERASASNTARPSSAVAFKKSRWQDVPYIFVVLIFVIGLVVIAVIDLRDYSRTQCFRNQYGDPKVAFYDPQLLAILGISEIITLLLSGVLLWIACAHTKHFIKTSMLIEITVSLVTAVFFLAQRRWLAGTLSLIWLLISGVMYWILRSFIVTATAQLKIALSVLKNNPSIWLISFLGAIFVSAWSIFIGSVVLAGLGKTVSPECSVKQKGRPQGEFVGLLVFLGFTNYMMTELVRSLVRVATCYTFGWWAFMPDSNSIDPSRVEENRAPDEFPNITIASWLGVLGGLTYSLGTICISSISLAMLKTLTQILTAWSQKLMVDSTQIKVSEDLTIILLAWVLSNFVWYIDSVISQFSSYALVYVAVDNLSFLSACREAVNLIVAEGIGGLINDSLASGALTFAPWCIASLVSFGVYTYMRWINPYSLQEGIFFVCSYVALLTFQISGIVLASVSSGAQTLFVVVSNEPARFRQVHPRSYQMLTEVQKSR